MAYKPRASDLEDLRNATYSPVSKDIEDLRGTGKLPENGFASLKDLIRTGKGPRLNPAVIGKSAVQGLAAPIANVGNLIGAGINKLIPGANIAEREPKYISPEEQANYPMSAIAGNVAANLGAFLGGGEALESGRLAAEGLPYIGRGAQYLGRAGLPGLVKRALGAGLFGAAEDKEHPVKSAIKAAATSAGLETIPFGLQSLLNWRLKKIAEGGRNSLQKAAEINASTNAPLSIYDIAGNQAGQRMLNEYVGKVPFSGVKGDIKKGVQDLGSNTNNLMDYFKGETDPADIEQSTKDAIIRNFENTKALDSKNYRTIDEIAKDKNIQHAESPNLKEIATKYAKEHNAVVSSGNVSGLDETGKNVLRSILSEKYNPTQLIQEVAEDVPLAKEEATKSTPDLKTALLARSLYGKASNENYMGGKNYLGSMYGDLKDALDKDITQTIGKSNFPDLQNSWKAANKFHKDNVIPYTKNGFITKLYNNTADIDNLSKSLLKSNNDKILQDLMPEERRAIAFKHLSKGAKEGVEWNPNTILNKYDSLSPRQKQSLFTSEEREQIKNLRNQYEGNQENILAMKKPATGYATLGTHVAPLVASGAAATYLNPYYAAIPLAAITGARIANKALRSKALKKAFLEPKKAQTSQVPGSKALISQIFGNPQS